ncbi:hypothetical protein D9M71_359530 [compost metagenome]
MSDRQTAGRELAVGVIAHGALVGAAEQRAVGPFKVEHQPQRFTDLGVRESRTAAVHEQALGLGRDLMGNLRLDHLAAAYGGEVVAGVPVLRLVLDIDVEFTGLERLERHDAVAVELDLHAVEVVLAAIDRQVLAPVILDPFEDDLSSWRDRGDAIRPAAQRRLESGGLEVAAFPVVLRQHRHFTQAQDQQRIAGSLEHETDALRVEDVDPRHFLKAGAVQRMAFLEQHAIGERDVVGGDRRAVMEACFGTQVEHHPAAVLVVLHRLGNQAVAGRGLVTGRCVLPRADHQRFIELVDAVLQETRRGDRAGALEGVGVERVEGAKRHHPQSTALGRLRVDPVEVGKSGRVLERAELRITMAFADRRACGGAQGQADQEQGQGTLQIGDPIQAAWALWTVQ